MNTPVQKPITAEEMRQLIAAPLADPGRIYLPRGKRKALRGPKPVYENEFAPKVSQKEVKARKAEAKDRKLGTLLNYYATTATPFEDIAAYLKLELPVVIRCMNQRGRAS